MKKTYLVKKDPALNTEDNWIFMNGYEFAMFLKTPEGVSRKGNFGWLSPCSEDDVAIIIECSPVEAAKIDRENKRNDYKEKQAEEENIEVISYSSFYNDETEESGEDQLEDTEANVEEAAALIMRKKALKKAIELLPEDERHLISALYSPFHSMTETMYAKAENTTRSAVNALKRKALAHLREILEKNPYFFTAF